MTKGEKYDSFSWFWFCVYLLNFPEIRAVPLINPRRNSFEELKVHFLMEKEQQQKERLLKEYLHLIEIPIRLGHDITHIMKAARYLEFISVIPC